MQYFLDMDGVLVDFIPAVIKFHNLPCSPEDITDWDGLYKYFPGTSEELWGPLKEDFWANLPFTEEASTIIDLLAPYKPTILSSPVRDCAGGKQRWIKTHMPEYYDHARYIFTAKKTLLSGPGRVLLDDAEHFLDPWVAAGGVGILVPRPWNRKRGLPTLDCIRAAVEFLRGVH